MLTCQDMILFPVAIAALWRIDEELLLSNVVIFIILCVFMFPRTLSDVGTTSILILDQLLYVIGSGRMLPDLTNELLPDRMPKIHRWCNKIFGCGTLNIHYDFPMRIMPREFLLQQDAVDVGLRHIVRESIRWPYLLNLHLPDLDDAMIVDLPG